MIDDEMSRLLSLMGLEDIMIDPLPDGFVMPATGQVIVSATPALFKAFPPGTILQTVTFRNGAIADMESQGLSDKIPQYFSELVAIRANQEEGGKWIVGGMGHPLNHTKISQLLNRESMAYLVVRVGYPKGYGDADNQIHEPLPFLNDYDLVDMEKESV